MSLTWRIRVCCWSLSCLCAFPAAIPELQGHIVLSSSLFSLKLRAQPWAKCSLYHHFGLKDLTDKKKTRTLSLPNAFVYAGFVARRIERRSRAFWHKSPVRLGAQALWVSCRLDRLSRGSGWRSYLYPVISLAPAGSRLAAHARPGPADD